MKKIKVFILLITCILITGCNLNKTKEVGTLEQFESIASKNGLTVVDNTERYNKTTYINSAKLASINNDNIEMVVYEDATYASEAQEKHIKAFMNIKGTGMTSTKIKGNNYYHFSMISNGYYMVSSRIENTLIFAKTSLDNKDSIEALLKDMNY